MNTKTSGSLTNEIAPDRSAEGRCISVHWSLPVQCVLPGTHWENWHETWDPETGNRLRYRRSFGTYRTEELRNDEWTALYIPAPGESTAPFRDVIRERNAAKRASAALAQF